MATKAKALPQMVDVYDEVVKTYAKAIQDVATLRARAKAVPQEHVDSFGFTVSQAVKEDSLNEQIVSIRNMALARTYVIRDAYLENLRQFMQIDGSRLTDDKDILTGSFDLSQEDLDRLITKYRNENYTMTALCANYARQHGLLYRPYPTVDAMADILDGFDKQIQPRFLEHIAPPHNGTILPFDETVAAFRQRLIAQTSLMWEK